MLDWLKRRLMPPAAPPRDPVPADEALRQLRQVVSDAAFEDVWEAMDFEPTVVEQLVRTDLEDGVLGEYPKHAAMIWLGQTLAGSGRTIDREFGSALEASIAWALGFDENTVLLGAALGALDSIDASQREDVAVRLFTEAGPTKPRRYWLLLKVRTDAMMDAVCTALGDFVPAATDGDPHDEDFVYTPTAANHMAGAFRQFTTDDYELARRYFDLGSPGAQFLVEALGSTQHPDATGLLREALEDERDAVSSAAARWLRLLSD